MKIFAIIVTYNAEAWIYKCFNSLRNSGLKIDIIAIDNGSIDNTIEIIEKDYPEVLLIKSKENLGFGKANNIGINLALENQADYVFLLNQDAWIDKNCIESLVSVAEQSNDRYGILSPVHYSGNMKDFDKGFLHYCKENLITEHKKNKRSIIDVNSINGAFMFISKQCLNTVKHFDPLFNFYGEDIDYCNRVKNAGYKIGVVVDALAYHDRQERKMTNERLYNHLKANHLIQIKSIVNTPYAILFLKTIYSAFFQMVKCFFKLDLTLFLLYFKVIFYLLMNFKKIKNSYFEYGL